MASYRLNNLPKKASQLILQGLLAGFFMTAFNTSAKCEKHIEIAGRVVFSDNGRQLPLERACIYCIGTTIQSLSDENGTFSLSVPKNKKGIIISYAGYKPLFLSIENLKKSHTDQNITEFSLTPETTASSSDI